jgi:hypothetical protein
MLLGTECELSQEMQKVCAHAFNDLAARKCSMILISLNDQTCKCGRAAKDVLLNPCQSVLCVLVVSLCVGLFGCWVGKVNNEM